jgi:hypothetical protein
LHNDLLLTGPNPVGKSGITDYETIHPVVCSIVHTTKLGHIFFTAQSGAG